MWYAPMDPAPLYLWQWTFTGLCKWEVSLDCSLRSPYQGLISVPCFLIQPSSTLQRQGIEDFARLKYIVATISEAFNHRRLLTDHRKNFKGDGAFPVPICHLSTQLSVLIKVQAVSSEVQAGRGKKRTKLSPGCSLIIACFRRHI